MKKYHRILIISNLYPSRKNPFYGSFVKNFVEELYRYAPNRNIELCLLKGKSATSFGKLCKYIIFYFKILYYLFAHKYEFVYVHLITHSTIPIRFVSLFKRLNLIFNIHGQDLLVTTPLASKLLEFAKPMLYKASYIVVPSNYFKTITLNKLPNIPEQKILVSASGGVSNEFFINKKNSNSVPIIGYVSRVDKGKGWDIFIKAAKILTDAGINAKYLIIGGGQEVELMNKLLTSLKSDNIHYLGPKKYSELPAIYSTFDLFVFPTTLEESLGLVGLEAMAAGVPVIGSRIGGLVDYIDEGVNGFFFEPSSPTSLAIKIKYFLSMNDLELHKMSIHAQKTAERFRDTYVSKQLFDRILK